MKEEREALEKALAERFQKEELMPSADFFENIYAGSQRTRAIQRSLRLTAVAASIAILLAFWFFWEAFQYELPQKAEKKEVLPQDSVHQNLPILQEETLSAQDTFSQKTPEDPSIEDTPKAPLSPAPQASPQLYTAIAQDTWHTLPDGSLIRLKQGSTLKYSRSELMERVAQLEGEAFFEVRKAQNAFLVLGKNTRIEVVGTAFLVKTQEEAQADQVWVKEGTVKVSPRAIPQKVETLKMGEKAKIEQKGILRDINSINTFSWVEQEIKFENSPIREVIGDLEHHFGVSIRVENPKVLDCQITATFSSPRLDIILKVIDKLAGIQHTQDPEGYLLLGEACQ